MIPSVMLSGRYRGSSEQRCEKADLLMDDVRVMIRNGKTVFETHGERYLDLLNSSDRLYRPPCESWNKNLQL